MGLCFQCSSSHPQQQFLHQKISLRYNEFLFSLIRVQIHTLFGRSCQCLSVMRYMQRNSVEIIRPRSNSLSHSFSLNQRRDFFPFIILKQEEQKRKIMGCEQSKLKNIKIMISNGRDSYPLLIQFRQSMLEVKAATVNQFIGGKVGNENNVPSVTTEAKFQKNQTFEPKDIESDLKLEPNQYKQILLSDARFISVSYLKDGKYELHDKNLQVPNGKGIVYYKNKDGRLQSDQIQQGRHFRMKRGQKYIYPKGNCKKCSPQQSQQLFQCKGHQITSDQKKAVSK